MNSRLSRRLMIAFGLVLTIAALAAPSANANMRPIYSDHGVTLIASSSEPNRLLLGSRLHPDPARLETEAKPNQNQACSSHGCTPIPPPQVSDPSGFDWSKTGFIVSLSMVGLLLLGGGALLAGKHNRRRRRRLAAA